MSMASYVIAGRADDPSFARAEFAAKQIEAACPNVFFRYEMRHPDSWKEFICNVFRQYDFDGYSEEFGGPLIWTHEGELVGGGSEFVQKVCIDKFGIRDPPSMSDPMFRQIAADNLKQVRLQLYREQNGPPFAERCEAACIRAHSAGLVKPKQFDERRRVVASGASLEVWVSSTLEAERVALREAYGDGQPACIDSGLKVASVGQDLSHMVAIHPDPLSWKQLVLVPERLVREHRQTAGTSGPLAESDDAALAVPMQEVRPRLLRNDIVEDLSLVDFIATMEALISIGGIATWSGLRGGSEYRHPLDTHIQVLPFPLHSQGEDCPLRYPLELTCEAALREGLDVLKVFPFKHAFYGIAAPEGTPEERKKTPKVLGQAALDVYEAAKLKLSSREHSSAIAFTTTWLVFMPLVPPEPGTSLHEAWLRMPPPPPCALCGVVVAPAVSRAFPETAGLLALGGKLVTTRAEQEGIPEGTPEFEAASREVQIASAILDQPAKIIGVWAAA